MNASRTHFIRFAGLAAALVAMGILATSALARPGLAPGGGTDQQLYPATNVDPSVLRDSVASPGHLGTWARGEVELSPFEHRYAGMASAASAARDSSTDAGHLGQAGTVPIVVVESGSGFAWRNVGAGIAAALLVALLALGAVVTVRRARHEPKRA